MKTFQKKVTMMGLTASLLMTSSVFAAPYLPDRIQKLEDDDVESIFQWNSTNNTASAVTNPNRQIQNGDLFAGVFRIQKTFNVGPSGPEYNLQGSAETFTALFLIQATNVTSTNGNSGVIDGSTDTLTFGAASQTQWNTIFGAGGLVDISSVFSVSNINGSGSGLSTGTMALFFNGVEFDDTVQTGSLGSSASSFINGGTLEYEFGFKGDAGEFWTTKGTDAAIPANALEDAKK